MGLSSKSTRSEPIAIIGSGCRFPGADTPEQFWELLQHPRDVRSTIPTNRFNAKGFYDPDCKRQGSSHTQYGYFLQHDARQFDSEFFDIKPIEAHSMDPQQRLLLEVVYESIESAGLSLEGLRGSPTGVYVGLMAVDFDNMMNRDTSDFPPYAASGAARSIASNRLSYFFDWRGPSMTIDTACSSSMVAVHLAVQSLRAGECRLAVAAGANLLLGPEQFIAGSDMNMLSPDGRSYWCDARANGYARGEGIAAVVLKPLSLAIADGDDIESIIVESALNQDGRSQGLTVPSAAAQASLIKKTYMKADLNLDNPLDRPQYFEAHGTGTPTGDPIEMQAVHDVFFNDMDNADDSQRLYCGSVKTLIGHTEGTAGLAGLMKASLALQHGVIPPNYLFDSPASKVKSLIRPVEFLHEPRPWPHMSGNGVRRASVNSFGFGGTNAHCILQNYQLSASQQRASKSQNATHLLFLFSAKTEKSLQSIIKSYLHYLETYPSTDLRALSHTLCSRRTALPVRLALSAKDGEDLYLKLKASLEANDFVHLTSMLDLKYKARILGIFTGQGAQWVGMARRLMCLPAAVRIIEDLEHSLVGLPDSPEWSLKAEISKDPSHSRITEAAIAQPICTAVQILLVKMLRAAGIDFAAVVGHSSGEMAAAYAAGYLSARDAMRISYYRGVHLPLVGGVNGETGGMMAVGASYAEAKSICDRETFRGKICIGACNSGSSVTLSGDLDTLLAVQADFLAKNRFARMLKVDNAYHSHHMLRCSEAITASLRACKIESRRPSIPRCAWVSSVYAREITSIGDSLNDEYWHSNTIGQVLFAQALERSLKLLQFDLAIEVGAHPALKGPALQVMQDTLGHTMPYTGLLHRGMDDVAAFSRGLGHVWANVCQPTVDFAWFDKLFGLCSSPRLLKGLPSYPWDHEISFWHESRRSQAFRNRSAPHELLGTRSPNCAEDQVLWEQFITCKQNAWVIGHKIRGQIVWPAAAYIVTALEAALSLAASRNVRHIVLTDFMFSQPLVFEDEGSRFDVGISLTDIREQESIITAKFKYHSIENRGSGPMTLNAQCDVKIFLNHGVNELTPPTTQNHLFGMRDVDTRTIYESFAQRGYEYTGDFKALSAIKRRAGVASGLVRLPPSTLRSIHPATLDAAMHSIMVAHAYPGDGRIRSLSLPTEIAKITIDVGQAGGLSDSPSATFISSITNGSMRVGANTEISTVSGLKPVLQLEGLFTKPMHAITAGDDVCMFSETIWGPADISTDHESQDPDACPSPTRGQIRLVAAMIRQISHRHPRLKILSIGTPDQEQMTHLLSEIEDSLATITITAANDNDLDHVKNMLILRSDRVVLKTLDTVTDISEQGFVKNSFDFVIAFITLAEVLDRPNTLEGIRNLLKAGGYLMCDPLSQSDDSPSPLALGSRADSPFNRVDDNTLLPNKSYTQGSRVLENYGFVEPVPFRSEGSNNDDSTIVMLQAVNKRIGFIRAPVILANEDMPLRMEKVTVIGGLICMSSSPARKILEALKPHCAELSHIDSITALPDMELPVGSTVIFLQDVDGHLFRHFDQRKLKRLQELFRTSKNILWVTHGYRNNEPYPRMSVAFVRSLLLEVPHIRMQVIDFDTSNTVDAGLIVEDLVRMIVTQRWEDQGFLNNMLWSFEPEISYVNGRALIPRVKPIKAMNDRYNSKDRVITRSMDLNDRAVRIVVEFDTYKLKATSVPADPSRDAQAVSIRVTYSFHKALQIERCGSLYLLLGMNSSTNEQIIALSPTISSRLNVPKALVRKCSLAGSSAIKYLHMVFCELIASAMLRGLDADDLLVVNQADEEIARSLSGQAATKNIRVAFSSVVGSHTQLSKSSSRTLELNPIDISHDPALARIVYWNEDDVRLSRYQNVPEYVQINSARSYLTGAPRAIGPMPVLRAAAALNQALQNLKTTASETSNIIPTTMSLQDLNGKHVDLDPRVIVDWTISREVTLEVEPIDRIVRFDSDKTYWLIGLTGELGLSLCEWMISRGAYNIVLSSRDPKVNQDWLEHFDTMGANVLVRQCDVTSFASVESALNSIETVMPPVAGLCHGAMVLHDALFADLDITQVKQVLKPKITGATNLDELFGNRKLEFFVLLSSIAAITGNPGQTIYAAANGFMAGLAVQRRTRGLCASSINLGAVLGIGVTRTLSLGRQRSMQQAGVMWTSEQDFHYAFAEAVAASQLSNGLGGEFTTGVPVCHTDDKQEPRHAKNPIFSHMIMQKSSAASLSITPKHVAESAKSRLLRVTSKQEATTVLEEIVSTKLRRELQMPQNSTLLDKSADSLGIDSLIAGGMRSWMRKELDIDLPLMVIIGGSNIRYIVSVCQSLLDPSITPLVMTE